MEFRRNVLHVDEKKSKQRQHDFCEWSYLHADRLLDGSTAAVKAGCTASCTKVAPRRLDHLLHKMDADLNMVEA